MATRGQNVLTLSHLSVFLFAVALLALNAAISRASTRVDLTADKVWTLSDGSRQVLAGLRDPADIKVFWKDVPKAESEADRRYLLSLLEEMRDSANGQLTVRWVDMDDKDGKKEADDLHVQPIQMTVAKEGDIRAVDTYQALVIQHRAAEPETIQPLVGARDEYEYKIATALHRMSRGEVPGIGLVSSQPPMDPFGGGGGRGGRFSVIAEVLRDQYGTAVQASVSLDEPVPQDVKILLVAAPESFEPKQIWNLEQFALRGGKVVLYVDPVNAMLLQQAHGVGSPVASGLEDWLAHVGVTVERAVVGEWAPEAMLPYPDVRGRRLQGFANFPYWVAAREPFMDPSIPATRGFDTIPFFWPAPIAIDAEKTRTAGRKATAIVRTSPYAARQADIASVQPSSLQRPREEDLLTFNLAVLVEGPLESFWKGKTSPVEEEQRKKDEEEKKSKEEEAKKDVEDGQKPDGAKSDEPKDGEPKETEPKTDEPKEGDLPPAPDSVEKSPEPPKSEDAKPAEPAPDTPRPDEPKGDEPKPDEPKPDEPKGDEPKGPPRLDQGNVTVLVLGDAEMIADSPAAEWAQQLRMMNLGYDRGFRWTVNVVDWMSGSDALLALRARSEKPRRLEDIEPSKQSLLALVNIAGVPLLLLFAGIVVFLVRKLGK